MTRPIPEPRPVDPGAQELIDRIRAQMEAQKWYQRFSNTVTSAAGAVLIALWAVAQFGYEIPDKVTDPVYIGLGLLTTLGVLKTRNGITPSVERTLVESAPSPGDIPKPGP